MANYRNNPMNDDQFGNRNARGRSRTGRSDQRNYNSERSSARSGQDLSGRLIASDRVEGTPVYSRNGERLGTIENFMVGKRSGRVEYAVLSFGGFLGMGKRHYPLPWDELDYDERENGYVVDMTEEDLDNAPSLRAGENVEYDRGFGSDVRSYYGSH